MSNYYVYYPLDKNGEELSSVGMFDTLNECEALAKSEKNCITCRIERRTNEGWEFIKFINPRKE